MKNFLKKLLYNFPLKNCIVFESKPDLSDNTKYVFEEMLRRGINKKYKMVWCVNHPKSKSLKKMDNVIYIYQYGLKAKFYRNFAKVLISCNDFYVSKRNDQFSLYLGHGNVTKSVRAYYTLPYNVDRYLVTSKNIIDIMAYEINTSAEKAIALGYPRNDAFNLPERDLHPLFPDKDFDKLIVWYPTYRQHKNKLVVSAGSSLPVIHDSDAADKLNDYAKTNRLLIVLKPHFAQDVSQIKNMNLSNIVFIDDTFFTKNNIASYEFVGSCDALITDYSSIYYDFLLKDKPIAVVWEDIEDYKKFPGFGVNVEEYFRAAEKVYNLEEMIAFLDNIANGNDPLKKERSEMCEFINYSKDGKNSERVVDFILEEIKKKSND